MYFKTHTSHKILILSRNSIPSFVSIGRPSSSGNRSNSSPAVAASAVAAAAVNITPAEAAARVAVLAIVAYT